MSDETSLESKSIVIINEMLQALENKILESGGCLRDT